MPALNNIPGFRTRFQRSVAAFAIWIAVAFSLGWYYTFTYYGRAGWPMPMPEPCAALVLYYFSVLNVDTELQAIHWLLVFPLAGYLWSVALIVTARRVLPCKLPDWSLVMRQFSLAAIPLALPGPWMAWIAGVRDEEFTWERMFAVALRRGNVEPWPWLTPTYVALGVVAFAIQIAIYRKLFRGTAGQLWVLYPAAMVVLVLSSSVFAAVAALPLRWLFE